MTPTLFITCGYSFAGKSTIAKYIADRYNFNLISIDDINSERSVGLNGEPISQKDWETTYQIFYKRIRSKLSRGNNVIADTAAFTKKERDILIAIANKTHALSRILFIDAPKDIVRSRWSENNESKSRSVVSKSNFELVLSNFEKPAENNVIRIPFDMTKEAINMLLEKEHPSISPFAS